METSTTKKALFKDTVSKALIVLIAFFSLNAFGQNSYFKKALIIKSDSSTLTGYVEKVSESSMSFNLKFKKSLEDIDHQILPVADIEQVIFTVDSSLFQKVRYTHYNYKDTTRIVEYRLAKKLLSGYADLYKLQLPMKELNIVFEGRVTFAYILKIDTTYYTLEQKEKLEGTTYHLSRKYLGVLFSILKGNKKLQSKLNDLKFCDKEIIPFIDELNASHPEIPRTVLLKKEKPIVTHGPVLSFAGLDNGVDAAGSGFETGYSISVINPEVNEHVSTDFGISLGRIWYTMDNNDRYPAFLLELPFTCTYHFDNGNISPFIGIGIAPFFSGEYVYYGLSVRAFSGVSFSKRLFLSFTLESTESEGILLLSFGYVFGATDLETKR